MSSGRGPASSLINNSCDHSKAKLKPLEITNHNAASSSTSTNDNQHSRALALSKLIHQDLISMRECMEYVNSQINQAFDKLEELQARGGSEMELHELKKAIAKLKLHIPSQHKSCSADSNPNRNPWPDVNKASDEMMDHLYKEKRLNFDHDIDSRCLLKAADDKILHYVICFMWFPAMAIIKKRVMIYLWMAHPFMLESIDEDIGNGIFDELIAKGFIEPVYQKCSLVPDSCTMNLLVRDCLANEMPNRIKSHPDYDSNQFFVGGRTSWWSCLINVRAPIIDGGQLGTLKRLRICYLGRWQNSATHHIEVTNTNSFDVLKNRNDLRFLSLQGISVITELPPFIPELTSLEILDLRACHNLEVIPDNIGSLQWLTHLDMSECYFLEHMPKGLANLSSLQVLKGFFVGDTKSNKRSCTLDNLSELRLLRKLNIYTNMKGFPTERHLRALERFRALRKLTISWGGCSSLGENDAGEQAKDDAIESFASGIKHREIKGHSKNNRDPTIEATTKPTTLLKRLLTVQSGRSPPTLPSTLQKLDLQCFRGTSPPSWLRPENLKKLKKLYIKGGQLCDLGQFQKLNDEDKWTVEILHLKYMTEL